MARPARPRAQLGVVTPRDRATGMASGRRQHGWNLPPQKEIEALQKAIEAESQRQTLRSDLEKARHAAAMNAIRNMKG